MLPDPPERTNEHRTRVSKLPNSAWHGIAYRGKKERRKEAPLFRWGTGHGLRIIEWSREEAKLMEKVVPFIRGSKLPRDR